MFEHDPPNDRLTVPIWKKAPGSFYHFDLRDVEAFERLPQDAREFCELVRASHPTALLASRRTWFKQFVAKRISPIREFVRISPQAVGDSVSEPKRLDYVDRAAKHVAQVQLWFRRELVENQPNDHEFEDLCADAQALADKHTSMLGLGARANEINWDAAQRRSLEALPKTRSEVADFVANSAVEANTTAQSHANGVRHQVQQTLRVQTRTPRHRSNHAIPTENDLAILNLLSSMELRAELAATLRCSANQSETAGTADRGEPNDIISTRVATQRFHVSSVTLQRAFRKGKIHSYRKPGAPKNAEHQFSYAELDRLYERRPV